MFLVDAKTEEEARALMETLPLAKEQLMDHVYIPVAPLDAAAGIDERPAASVSSVTGVSNHAP